MAQQEERNCVQYFERIFTSSHEGIFFVDPEGCFTRINPAVTALLGYAQDDLEGKPFSDIVHKAAAVKKLSSVIRLHHFIRSEKEPIEMVLLDTRGRSIPVSLRSAIIHDSDGGVQGAMGMLEKRPEKGHDRGLEVKSVQEKIWEIEQNYQNILNNSGDAVFLADFNGLITTINNALVQMTGFAENELLGRHLMELTPLEGTYTSTTGERITFDEQLLETQVERSNELFETGRVTNYELYFLRRDGKVVPVETTLSLLRNKNGERRGSIAICRDITKRKTGERELLTAKDKIETANQELRSAIEQAQGLASAAQAADRAKSQFLANISHEIRTPMNGIIGFTEMIIDTGLTPEQEDFANTIKRSAEALLSIINDILDFSKIESGQFEFESIGFDPELLAYDVCELIRPKTGDKPIEIILRVADDVPSEFTGDPFRFRQVLVNLMGNAAKFTEEGEIELSITIDAEEPSRVKFHAMVRDTGIGIPEDRLASVFEPFIQADGSITRKYGGTGLGLSICRKIADIMGGDVWAESSSGTGSTFHFTGWMKTQPGKQSARRPTPRSLAGRRILIADDNANNREIMKHVLELAKMQVTVLSSGEEVVPAVQHAMREGSPFDICVLDIQMPVVSGYDAARRLRELNISIPLIAASSLSDRNAKECEQHGFNGFMPKPVSRNKLIKMIEFLLSEEPGAEPEIKHREIVTQYSVQENVKHTVCILLAEDNPVNQKLAKTLLVKAGYSVHVAKNGKEAVAVYTASPELFSLVFMDLQMPELSGIEATKSIRQQGFDTIPIVAMTAHAMKGDRERCIEAGMNDYISKPIKREAVFEMVRKWVLEKY